MELEDFIPRLRQHADGEQLSRRRRKSLPPRATPAELAKAEEQIGFPLPPLLRALYSEIANGRFGPGIGLMPLFGDRGRGENGVVDSYLGYRQLARESQHEAWRDIRITWPPHLVPILDEGCARTIAVDCSKAELPVKMFDPNRGDSALSYAAASLERWLDRWMSGR